MMTRVGLGTTCYPSQDDDTCRVGFEPRIQSVTAWREKSLAIKVNLTEFVEVRFSLRLIARVVCTLVRFYRVYFLSVFGCSCHWLERRSATGRRGTILCFQVLRETLSVVWTWKARGVKLVRRFLTRQRSCARSTGRIIWSPPWGRIKGDPNHSSSLLKFWCFLSNRLLSQLVFEVLTVHLEFLWVAEFVGKGWGQRGLVQSHRQQMRTLCPWRRSWIWWGRCRRT